MTDVMPPKRTSTRLRLVPKPGPPIKLEIEVNFCGTVYCPDCGHSHFATYPREGEHIFCVFCSRKSAFFVKSRIKLVPPCKCGNTTAVMSDISTELNIYCEKCNEQAI